MLGGCLLLQPLATAETVLPLPAHRTLPAGRGGGYGAARRTADILRALNRQHFYNPLEHNRGAGGRPRPGGLGGKGRQGRQGGSREAEEESRLQEQVQSTLQI
jgi:hypothetical protein